VRSHNLGYTQPNGDEVGSVQQTTIRCEVCEAKSCADYEKKVCNLPMAKAFDHMDQEVHVETHLYLVDKQIADGNGGLKSETVDTPKAKINFTKRATYLLKYDAVDFAGNRAEQAVVALILDDLNPPEINVCNGLNEVVEAGKGSTDKAQGWFLCTSSSAFDQVDKDVTDHIRYKVCKYDGAECKNTAWTEECLKTDANGCSQSHLETGKLHGNLPIKDTEIGSYEVTIFAQDEAGIYGQEYANNYATQTKLVTVQDTQKPVIKVAGANPHTLECSHDYTDEGAAVFDQLDNLWNPEYRVLDYNAQGPAECTGKASNQCKCGDAAECANFVNGVDIRPEGLSKSTPSRQVITYFASDDGGLPAQEETREVLVLDRTIPVLKLSGASKIVTHQSTETDQDSHTAGNADPISEPGWTCVDACDRLVNDNVAAGHDYKEGTHATPVVTSLRWLNGKPFRDDVEGDYIREYKCCDASDNCATATRTFTVEDNEAPRITVVDGDKPLILEAQHNTDYADAGATCSDYVDKQLDNQVIASGDLVQMAVPGTYTIIYNCADISGNDAAPMTRTVIVQDTTCPQVKINGAKINYLEAGFPFEDKLPSGFATAYDTLDGDLTDDVTSEGDSVTTSSIFYQRRSCEDIKYFYRVQGQTEGAHTAEYYVTRWVNDHHERVLVWCDMGTTEAEYGHTLFYKQNGIEVSAPYNGGVAKNSCQEEGLELPQLSEADRTQGWYLRAKAKWPRAFECDGSECKSDTYICVAPKSGRDHDESEHVKKRWSESTKSQMGKYVIDYVVMDKAGNRNNCDDEAADPPAGKRGTPLRKWKACNSNSPSAAALCTAEGGNKKEHCLECKQENARRTVIVKDNLPPIISLHDRKGLWNNKNDGDKTNDVILGSHNREATTETHRQGGDGEDQFAGALSLMAEQSSSSANGWVLGAVASAVTGLALVGLSMRKEQTVATSVPV